MFYIKEYEQRYNEKINDFIISILVEEYGFEKYRQGLMNEDNSIYHKNGNCFWVAVNEYDEIVGTVALIQYDEKNVELKKLYVRKDYRGTGLSKMLYEKVINVCKMNTFERIFLGTYYELENAINFYLRRGFKQIEEFETNEVNSVYFEMYLERGEKCIC